MLYYIVSIINKFYTMYCGKCDLTIENDDYLFDFKDFAFYHNDCYLDVIDERDICNYKLLLNY